MVLWYAEPTFGPPMSLALLDDPLSVNTRPYDNLLADLTSAYGASNLDIFNLATTGLQRMATPAFWVLTVRPPRRRTSPAVPAAVPPACERRLNWIDAVRYRRRRVQPGQQPDRRRPVLWSGLTTVHRRRPRPNNFFRLRLRRVAMVGTAAPRQRLSRRW
jgi:hypothetical protein